MRIKHVSHVIAACAFTSFFAPGAPLIGAPMPRSNPAGLPTPFATITYASATSPSQTIAVYTPCLNGIFALVGLQPGQIVQIVVQYPQADALKIVNVRALDGGLILPPNVPAATGTILNRPDISIDAPLPLPDSLAISVDGTLSFTFQGASNPGKNHISLYKDSKELGLEFWVFDALNPENNPPAISPDNQIYPPVQ